jgi:hypothetical protein
MNAWRRWLEPGIAIPQHAQVRLELAGGFNWNPILWAHNDVAGIAMEVGAILGCNNLKAIWDALHGWHVVAFALSQTSCTGLLANRAA